VLVIHGLRNSSAVWQNCEAYWYVKCFVLEINVVTSSENQSAGTMQRGLIEREVAHLIAVSRDEHECYG
jgi:hypothetical protein